MIVVDASVIVELLLQTPLAAVVEHKLLEAGGSPHAPHLIDIEVAQVIRRLARLNLITDARGALALGALAQLSLRRHPHTAVLARVWELRHNLSAYDACYVALAVSLGAELLTRDHRLAAAVGAARVVTI